MHTNASQFSYSTATAISERVGLADLVGRLEAWAATKADFVADARTLAVEPVNGGGLALKATTAQTGEWLTGPTRLNPNALTQLGERADPGVPGEFLKRLADARPNRAADLLSGLLADKSKNPRTLIRCLGGEVRAVLSDRFRTIDNIDVLLPVLEAAKAVNAVPFYANVTPDRMRLILVSRDVTDVVDGFARDPGGKGNLAHKWVRDHLPSGLSGKDDGAAGVVRPIVTISNSETGNGGLSIQTGIFHDACLNTAISATSLRAVHLGERLEAGVYTADTIRAEARSITLKARDTIAAAFDVDKFRAFVARCRALNTEAITAPAEAVDALIRAHDAIGESLRDSLLSHFIRDYKPTRYGLAQAVARVAQDAPNPDRAEAIEQLAGQLLNA